MFIVEELHFDQNITPHFGKSCPRILPTAEDQSEQQKGIPAMLIVRIGHKEMIHTCTHNCLSPLCTMVPAGQHNCTPHHPSLSPSNSRTERKNHNNVPESPGVTLMQVISLKQTKYSNLASRYFLMVNLVSGTALFK